MASIKIPRPRKFVSKNGNSYVKVSTPSGIVRVMLDDAILDEFDNIQDMEFDYEHYTQKTVDGKLVDEAWSRLECIDYTTTTRELALATHKVAVDNLFKGISGSAKLNSAAEVKELAGME